MLALTPPSRRALVAFGSALVLATPAVALAQGALPTPISATQEADVLVGTDGPDNIQALAGNDVVTALGGDDVVGGGGGDDQIDGGAGRDTLEGNSGNDVVIGGPQPDNLSGGSGDDRLDAVDDSIDVIDCGGGNDVARLDANDLIDKVRDTCETIEVVGTFNPKAAELPPGMNNEVLLPVGAPESFRFDEHGKPAVGTETPGGAGLGPLPACISPKRPARITVRATRGYKVTAVVASRGKKKVKTVKGKNVKAITLRGAAGVYKLKVTARKKGAKPRVFVRDVPLAAC